MSPPDRPRSVHDSIDWTHVRRTTRWHATATTFGWPVKVLLTVPLLRCLAGTVCAVVALVVAVVTLSLPWWLVLLALPLAIWMLAWDWSALRHVWAQGRVGGPAQRPDAVPGDPEDARARELGRRPAHGGLVYLHGDDVPSGPSTEQPSRPPSRW